MSKLSEIVKIVENGKIVKKSSTLLKIIKIVKNVKTLKNCQKCQKLSKMSKLSKIVQTIKNCENCWKMSKKMSKLLKKIVKMLVRSCFLITLIKCLKGHKSLRSLCNVKSKSTVSDWVSQWQGHLLSCCGQLKRIN